MRSDVISRGQVAEKSLYRGQELPGNMDAPCVLLLTAVWAKKLDEYVGRVPL